MAFAHEGWGSTGARVTSPASHKTKEKLEDADVARRVVTPTCEDRCDRAPHIFSMGSGESRG